MKQKSATLSSYLDIFAALPKHSKAQNQPLPLEPTKEAITKNSRSSSVNQNYHDFGNNHSNQNLIMNAKMKNKLQSFSIDTRNKYLNLTLRAGHSDRLSSFAQKSFKLEKDVNNAGNHRMGFVPQT
jgi:hypothetical protein